MTNKYLKIALRFLLGAGVAVALCIAAFVVFVVQPWGSGVAATLHLDDGSEYMVTQKFGHWSEPYNVWFHSRAPGENWASAYIDHEAMLWKDVEMTYRASADSIVVTERGTLRAVLDLGRKTFWFDNGDFARTETAPEPEGGVPDFAFPADSS